MGQPGAQARLGPVDELDLRPVFQPIVDLRDGAVVGYEALMRSGPADGELHSAQALLAAARREDSMLALDLAARDAALRAADHAGLDAPFSLFLNADPATLDGELARAPVDALHAARRGHRAGADRAPGGDAARADAAALGRLGHRARRRRRRLALARADVDPLSRRDQARPARCSSERSPEDRARIVTAVGAEAERRHAAVLAEGIDSEEQLAARARVRRDARPGLPARHARRRCPSRCPSPAAR